MKLMLRGILKIDIHVSYSSPMPESAIIIVIRKIDLKTNSPVSELSSDIFGWSNLACYPVSQDKTLFFISIFFALRNDNQNASHRHHRCRNEKGRFKTTCLKPQYWVLHCSTHAHFFAPGIICIFSINSTCIKMITWRDMD